MVTGTDHRKPFDHPAEFAIRSCAGAGAANRTHIAKYHNDNRHFSADVAGAQLGTPWEKAAAQGWRRPSVTVPQYPKLRMRECPVNRRFWGLLSWGYCNITPHRRSNALFPKDIGIFLARKLFTFRHIHHVGIEFKQVAIGIEEVK